MKEYLIFFERENNTKGKDTFIGNTQQEAICNFNEVYRHGKYKIIDIKQITSLNNIILNKRKVELFTGCTFESVEDAIIYCSEILEFFKYHNKNLTIEQYEKIKTVKDILNGLEW